MTEPESLDYPLDQFQHYLNLATDLVIERYGLINEVPAFPAIDEAELAESLKEALPMTGQPLEEVLQEVRDKIFSNANMNIAPKVFAYVMAGGNQVSVIADLLASALNQNVAKWHLAPSLTEIEKLIFTWTAELLGLKKHRAGALVSGGSSANLTGLTIARNVFFSAENIRDKGLFGLPPFTVYGSTETHNSVDKSVELLGIGRQQYRKIPVGDDFKIDTEALRSTIEQDIAEGYRPFCIIGNAGTVNTGTIDPLDELAEIARHYKLWFHVDGCYGGMASSLASLKPDYQGIEAADSIALDFHKWLYQPFEIGCTLIKDWEQLRETFYTKASYLNLGEHDSSRFNINEHHFALSRNGKALKVWMSLKTYGAEAFKQMIAKDISMADYLAENIKNSTDFELISRARLGIVCFRYLGRLKGDEQGIEILNKKIIGALEADGRIFITGTILGGVSVIRACIINHRMQKNNIDHLVKVIREVGMEINK